MLLAGGRLIFFATSELSYYCLYPLWKPAKEQIRFVLVGDWQWEPE
jgi:hypothetical protein